MNTSRIDLHTHSYYSDGTMSPEEVVLLAKKNGVTALALTDHDTTEGLKEMEYYCGKQGICFVSGIELSCRENVGGKEIPLHIVGLFLQEENEELRAVLKKMREWRDKRNQILVMRMKEDGVLRAEEELLWGQSRKGIYKINFLNYLIREGYAPDLIRCQEKYFVKGKRYYTYKQKITANEAIATIHKAQGLAIAAHLNQYSLTLEQIELLLEQLKSYGMDGIETRYTTYSAEEEKVYQTLAKKWSLLESGGSDFHGKNKEGQDVGIGFGNLFVPECFLEDMEKCIREKRRKRDGI